MPDFTFSQAMTANQLDLRPLANWKYRRLPFNALVTILTNATGVSARETIDSGGQNIKQKSPVHAGGTAQVFPIPQTAPVYQFHAAAGDEIIVSFDEVAGATPTVNLYVNVEPTG